jgi:hypothetical protein
MPPALSPTQRGFTRGGSGPGAVLCSAPAASEQVCRAFVANARALPECGLGKDAPLAWYGVHDQKAGRCHVKTADLQKDPLANCGYDAPQDAYSYLRFQDDEGGDSTAKGELKKTRGCSSDRHDGSAIESTADLPETVTFGLPGSSAVKTRAVEGHTETHLDCAKECWKPDEEGRRYAVSLHFKKGADDACSSKGAVGEQCKQLGVGGDRNCLCAALQDPEARPAHVEGAVVRSCHVGGTQVTSDKVNLSVVTENKAAFPRAAEAGYKRGHYARTILSKACAEPDAAWPNRQIWNSDNLCPRLSREHAFDWMDPDSLVFWYGQWCGNCSDAPGKSSCDHGGIAVGAQSRSDRGRGMDCIDGTDGELCRRMPDWVKKNWFGQPCSNGVGKVLCMRPYAV